MFFVGVDQVNLRIPQLAGRGEVEVTLFLGEQQANNVRIRVR